jgi:hypothetical protein
LLKNSWKHIRIKILKLALSSNNGPYPKHGGHVSNLKKYSSLERTYTLGALAPFIVYAPLLYLVCDIGGLWDLSHKAKQLGIITLDIRRSL